LASHQIKIQINFFSAPLAWFRRFVHITHLKHKVPGRWRIAHGNRKEVCGFAAVFNAV